MTITAKNIGRINVWPTYRVAREADTEQSKFTGQLTVWQTNEEALANTSYEEEGGGGGAPDWVPANAVIHIDLVGGTPQGRAWVAGTGEVAVDTLVGNDPNADNYDTTALIPENFDVNGYYANSSLAFIGMTRDMVLAGATLVYRIYRGGTAPSLVLAMSTNYDNAINVAINSGSASPLNAVNGFGDTGSLNISTVNALLVTVGAINGIAITFVTNRLDLACNGSVAVTGVIGTAERPPGNPLTAFLIDIGNNNRLQSITLYDPLPSTAGLSELSEVT